VALKADRPSSCLQFASSSRSHEKRSSGSSSGSVARFAWRAKLDTMNFRGLPSPSFRSSIENTLFFRHVSMIVLSFAMSFGSLFLPHVTSRCRLSAMAYPNHIGDRRSARYSPVAASLTASSTSAVVTVSKGFGRLGLARMMEQLARGIGLAGHRAEPFLDEGIHVPVVAFENAVK
jgi:hypothetical protein